MPSRPRVNSAPDPFMMGELTRSDTSYNNRGYTDTNAKTVRAGGFTINPAIKTLVLITAGQSNFTSVATTAYAPTNGSALDNLNPYNGQMYVASDPLLGSSVSSQVAPFGVGSLSLRLADKFVTNGIFGRVIIVPLAVGGTASSMWGTGGPLYNRVPAAMARLASRGIVPGMTGVTFAFCWGQGESDAATTQIAYQTSLTQVLTSLFNAGFVGRAFINKQTLLSNVANPTVVAAQVAVVNGTTIFQGADADALTGAGNRMADNTHFNDTGMANLATAMYNAMHATGSPF